VPHSHRPPFPTRRSSDLLLAEDNLTDAQLESFAAAAGASLGPELTRFGTLLEMERIAAELEHSTARISDLIKAIKEYSYMDQARSEEHTSELQSRFDLVC